MTCRFHERAEAECKWKVHYGSRNAATREAKRMKRPLEPYRCPVGSHWHLGHRSARVRRK